MSYVDVRIANYEDFESSLGIPAYDGDMSRGIEKHIESYKRGMREIQKQFPNYKKQLRARCVILHTAEDGDWIGNLPERGGKF